MSQVSPVADDPPSRRRGSQSGSNAPTESVPSPERDNGTRITASRGMLYEGGGVPGLLLVG